MDTQPIKDAVDALSALRRSYKRLTRHPTAAKRQRCDLAHDGAVAALQAPAFQKLVDPIIKTALDADQGRAKEARAILAEAHPDVLRFERDLGLGIGFSAHELAVFLKKAIRTLDDAKEEKKTLPNASGSDALIATLEDVRQRVYKRFDSSVVEPRLAKRAGRRETAEYAMMRLYMVGLIVANAEYKHVFAYSYAISVGVGGSSPEKRKALRVATSELDLDERAA